MNECQCYGDWRKISELGSGAFGIVSLWKHKQTNEYIAVKKCKFERKDSLTERQKQRWINEVDIMKTMNHPNIIAFKEIPPILKEGLHKKNITKLPILSMEYCDKGNLRTVLRKTKNCCGLSEIEVRDILLDITNGIEFLHKNSITHRDIKPDNIVLHNCMTRESNTIYKIIDLGYAKDLNDTIVSFVGTLDYLAPEICQGKQYNYAVDYWSLGVLFFEVICGVHPFLPGKSLPERFQYIKGKDPEIICIYETNASGSFKSSKEILKYNQISSCLKTNIELWLKQVLQFNPQEREKNFPNGLTVFQQMRSIVNKRMLNVFWLHKLELYSYEIQDSTLIGTLKQWIQRDTKVEKEKFVVLFSKNINPVPDDHLVVDYLSPNNNVYVIRKDCFFNKDSAYNFPFYVRKLFEGSLNFGPKEVVNLCHQSIFYLQNDHKTIVYIKKSINLYIAYIKNLCLVSQQKYITVKKDFNDLSLVLRKLNLSFESCHDHSLRLKYIDVLDKTEKCLDELKMLNGRLHTDWNHSQKTVELYGVVDDVMKKCDVDSIYQNFVMMVEKNEIKSDDLKKVTQTISKAIKMKDDFLNSKRLQPYMKALHHILNSLEKLIKSMFDLDQQITTINSNLNDLDFLLKSAASSIKPNLPSVKPKQNESSHMEPTKNGRIFKKIDTKFILEENHSLRNEWSILINNIFCNDLFTDKFE
ncbi:unnamed protein product [Brassicogethes aeneus]|uniref:IkappaB kinase n=1 Tax=Brassicogethes aeneus TaxID=1431903 RepID=A0A9P0B3T3_BRAAE|nr:unnamed protein product [Brassicogethes aeneus]